MDCRRFPVTTGLAVSLALVLSACVAPQQPMPMPAPPTPSMSSPDASSPAAPEPLSCSELLGTAELAMALGIDLDDADQIVPTQFQGLVIDSHVVEAAGGLACDWTLDPDGELGQTEPPDYGSGISIDVLPDAAAEWTPGGVFGQPAEDRTFAGVDTSASCDGACGMSAAVGDTWLHVAVFPSWGIGQTDTDPEDDYRRVTPAFESLIRVLADASEGETSWTPPGTEPDRTMTCEEWLPIEDLRTAAEDPQLEYSAGGQPGVQAPAGRSVFDVANERAGLTRCTASGDREITFSAIPGSAWIVEEMAALTEGRRLTPFELEGLPAAETSVSNCDDARFCTVAFSLNGDAVQVYQSDLAVAIAQAIVAQSL